MVEELTQYKHKCRTSPVVQWLSIQLSMQETSIPGQGTKIPHAAEQLKEKPVLQPQEKKIISLKKKQTINADMEVPGQLDKHIFTGIRT